MLSNFITVKVSQDKLKSNRTKYNDDILKLMDLRKAHRKTLQDTK